MSLSSLSRGDRREVLTAIRKGRAVSGPRLAETTCKEAAHFGRLHRWMLRLWVGMAALGAAEVIATVMGTHLGMGAGFGSFWVLLGSLSAGIYHRMGSEQSRRSRPTPL